MKQMKKIASVCAVMAASAIIATSNTAMARGEVRVDGNSKQQIYEGLNLAGKVCFEAKYDDGTPAKLKWWYKNTLGKNSGKRIVTGAWCHEFVGYTRVKVGFTFDNPATVSIIREETNVFFSLGRDMHQPNGRVF
ncbi:hypothetical protein [Minwuia sp.]|uniref:hypothetical protein n=1 Tax=Minwuia sp. TaxID=2493630 RepID=UPI003A8C9229